MDSVATVVPYIMVLLVAGIACGYELGARSGSGDCPIRGLRSA
jgi:hypothetical protein